MTEAASKLLAAFDALSPSEQLELTKEILRRGPTFGDLPESALHEVAGELFLSYDAEEDGRVTC